MESTNHIIEFLCEKVAERMVQQIGSHTIKAYIDRVFSDKSMANLIAAYLDKTAYSHIMKYDEYYKNLSKEHSEMIKEMRTALRSIKKTLIEIKELQIKK